MNILNISINSGISFKGLRAWLISCKPKNISPTPIIALNFVLAFSFFININKIEASPTIGSPYLPMFSANNQPVIVVPILAPKITPKACFKVKREALTKPIVITVLTDDDCTKAVIIIPTKIPKNLLLVKEARILFSFGPAIFCILVDICSIPYKNNPKPPISCNIIFKYIYLL